MSKNLIYNAKLITPERIIENGYIVYENGKITDIGTNAEAESFEGIKINAEGKYLAPGFIDIHCHGGGGADFMDGTEEAFKTAAIAHSKHGTTTMLPTTLTCDNKELVKSFEIFNKVKKEDFGGANIIGLHLEGPYFNPEQAGAQDPRYIRSPKKEDYEYIYKEANGAILRWSMAPELPGADEFGAFLKDKGILASIAHTNASYQDVVTAYENGFNLLTHFYSAMSTIVRVGGYRIPGVIESGYIIEGMNVELIADGHHLPKELLNMVYKIKGADRIALVTDSMRGAGTDAKEMILGSLDNGLKCIVEDGVAKLPDRTAFAGSVCTTDRLVRTMYKTAGVPLIDAIKMITATPAKLINIDKTKGCLALGKDADFVLFDDDINIAYTIVNGKVIHTA